MGCIFGKLFLHRGQPLNNEEDTEPKKEYSWDKRPKINVKDFILDGLQSQVVGRMPGSVDGQQFIIQNCSDCDIYIFDHCATVTVDDCVNCRMFIGPTKTSIFIRDCSNCVVVTACQQFRTRDCKKLSVFLSCVTKPIIEATTGVKFGCFRYYYPELKQHFAAAGLSIFNNNWSSIHDFTPVPDENNYSIFLKEESVESHLPLPTVEPYNSCAVNTDIDQSVVPYTCGSKYKPNEQPCLITFFHSNTQSDIATGIISALRDLVLVQTAEMDLDAGQAKRIFGTDAFTSAINKGPAVILEYVGTDCVQRCHANVIELTGGDNNLVYVSPNSETAAKELEDFNNLTEMQMAV